jgi:hypothetical protein
MKVYLGRWLLVLGLAVGLASVNVIGQQTVPDTVAGHVAAAKAAGQTMWPSLVSQLCGPAEQAPAEKANPNGPNPFIVGTDGVTKYSSAIVAALR